MKNLNHKTRHFIVDPRSKFLILLLNSIFVFGGAGGAHPMMLPIRHVLIAIPLFFLLFEGKGKSACIAALGYAFFYIIQVTYFGLTKGLLNHMLLFSIGFFVRILPNVMAAYYLISTTTVSELISAMERMRFSNYLIIPIIVMMRFFPVVIEESNAVADAMRMRDVRFGGKKISKLLEYRFIPMITCSVKVGEELSASAIARGLGSPMKRTNICNIGFRGIDFFVFVFGILTIIVFSTTKM
ncbi:MAG: energy-coupling factor transporter transmembrane protein EcfT [Clostridiaceae bacterium]|nr:energy-coupling factor transporter transmembrane protein EcfT [Clostridiaceae bacterium]